MSSDSRDDETATCDVSLAGISHATTARTLTVLGNRIDSRDLFSGDREIIIAHGEYDYRLRLTSQNKLILTK